MQPRDGPGPSTPTLLLTYRLAMPRCGAALQVPAHGVAMYRLRHRQCPFVMGVYARGTADEAAECSKLRT